MSDDDLPLTPGYRLNSATVLRDLHRLLSAFLAYSPIRALADGEGDPLTMLQERFTEDEIVHQLVSTAIMNRLHMEHMHRLREDPDEMSFKPIEAACGEVEPRRRKARRAWAAEADAPKQWPPHSPCPEHHDLIKS